MRSAKPEREKIISRRNVEVVEFVHDQQYRFFSMPQNLGNVVVRGNQSRFCVDEKQYHVGKFHCNFRLSADMLEHRVFALKFDTAGIDERERIPAPLCVRINTITRYSGRILDD